MGSFYAPRTTVTRGPRYYKVALKLDAKHLYLFEPKISAVRVIINVGNQWNVSKPNLSCKLRYTSGALTFTAAADDGDADTKRCFLVFKKNLQVTDEPLKSRL